MALTAELARNAINRMEKVAPEQHWLLMKSLLIDAIERIDKLEASHAVTREGAMALATEFKDIRDFFGGLQNEFVAAQTRGIAAPPAAAAPAAPDEAVAGPDVRLGSDGGPLTPEQLAAEEVMDAATDAARAPAPTATPANGGTTPPRGGVRVAPKSGAIDDNEQAEIERLMDQAAGPRP
jgi:hypothetical protein